jgi:hypothetical protein
MIKGTLTQEGEGELPGKEPERIGAHTGINALPCAWIDYIGCCQGRGVCDDHGCLRTGIANNGMEIRGHQSGQVLKEEKSNNQAAPDRTPAGKGKTGVPHNTIPYIRGLFIHASWIYFQTYCTLQRILKI